jgi:F0F1-type ATP synthase epsilon subunit
MTDPINTIVTLTVSIKSKEKTLYNGAVHTVTSKNERGVFDVLSLHANFISLISDYIILDKGLPTEKRFDIEKGVLYVLSNKVDVYVGV